MLTFCDANATFIFFKVFILKKLFIYLFIGCVGLCCCSGFSVAVVHGRLIAVVPLVAAHGL